MLVIIYLKKISKVIWSKIFDIHTWLMRMLSQKFNAADFHSESNGMVVEMRLFSWEERTSECMNLDLCDVKTIISSISRKLRPQENLPKFELFSQFFSSFNPLE